MVDCVTGPHSWRGYRSNGMPEIINAREVIPLGGGGGRGLRATLQELCLVSSLATPFPLLMCAGHHPGWYTCNLT